MKRAVLGLLAAIFSIAPASAIDFPITATVTGETGLWEAANSQAAVVGKVPDGTAVTVTGCHDAWCAVTAPGVDGFVLAKRLTLPSGTTIHDERLAGVQPLGPVELITYILGDVRLEGDSYMGGACGVAIGPLISKAMGRLVVATAKGGSTMAESRDRVLAPENARYLNYVTVFWDGSQNGFVDAISYADELEAAIKALGHDHFIVIPAAIPAGQDSGTQVPAIMAEFEKRWPDNVLDWRGVLPVAANGGLADDQMCDKVHLNEGALNNMAWAIAGFIQSKSW